MRYLEKKKVRGEGEGGVKPPPTGKNLVTRKIMENSEREKGKPLFCKKTAGSPLVWGRKS